MGGCNKNCGDCDYNQYGPVASAFLAVPDNFNSVTNFVPKLPVYRALRVCDIATENGAYAKHGSACCDDGSVHEEYLGNGCCAEEGECDSLGFIRYPTSIRPHAVQVCGTADCVCAKGANHLSKGAQHDLSSSCCSDGNCVEDNALGFVNWPPIGYFKTVKACGPIAEEICSDCHHEHNKCKKCNVVVGPCREGKCH